MGLYGIIIAKKSKSLSGLVIKAVEKKKKMESVVERICFLYFSLGILFSYGINTNYYTVL